MSDTSVLITGFERFLDYPVNPTHRIMEIIDGMAPDHNAIETRVLRVEYDAVIRYARELKPHRYAAVIMTGLNHALSRPVLEQRAVNMMNARYADNAGSVRNGQPVIAHGEPILDTSIDLEGLAMALQQSGMNAGVSLHAGTFVCNALYYAILFRLLNTGIPCLFIHVPMTTDPRELRSLAAMILEIAERLKTGDRCVSPKVGDMMNQNEAEAYLYSYLNLETRTGLSYVEKNYNLNRFRELLHRLGDPHAGLQYIHVAGTKGKGAVCAMTAAILSAHGLRTGLYTSPHLVNVRERVRLDGKAISEADFAHEIQRLETVISSAAEKPMKRYRTVFELLTALAFLYFQKMHPQWVVLETGMGGRLDCTNVIDPVLSVVTRIDRDHTDSLGSALTGIAREKAGIAKPGIPVIVGEQTPYLRREVRRHIRDRGTAVERHRVAIRNARFLTEGTTFS
ncbi:MAG TPA: Mur ligase family protein, partial [bacterium]|nr:Mur ligase family protein [bacterium]